MLIKSWFSNYHNTQDKSAVIIGAGISGAYTAHYLAQYGYDIYVVDKNDDIAKGASGNAQAILYYSSSGRDVLLDEMFNIGYNNSAYLIKKLLIPNKEYQHSGSIHLATNARLKKQHLNIIKKQLSNFNHGHDKAGIFKPEYQNHLIDQKSIWIKPRTLISKLLDKPNIKIITDNEVTQLIYQNNKWLIQLANHQLIITGNVIICTGYELNNFKQINSIPIIPNSGQISLIEESLDIDKIVCFGGYLTPAVDGYHCLGATYHPNQIKNNISTNDHQSNIEQLNHILNKHLILDITQIKGRISTRGTTKDYYPIIGPITTYQLFKDNYYRLGYNPKQRIDKICPYLPGLYLNMGHGSKGMLSSSFAGELIACYITNQNINCTNQLREKVHPNRFWLKRLIYENNLTH